jgi:hypothetical protein
VTPVRSVAPAAPSAPVFVDVSSWSSDEFKLLANASGPDREKLVLERAKKLTDTTVEDVRRETPLTFFEDVLAMVLLGCKASH